MVDNIVDEANRLEHIVGWGVSAQFDHPVSSVADQVGHQRQREPVVLTGRRRQHNGGTLAAPVQEPSAKARHET